MKYFWAIVFYVEEWQVFFFSERRRRFSFSLEFPASSFSRVNYLLVFNGGGQCVRAVGTSNCSSFARACAGFYLHGWFSDEKLNDLEVDHRSVTSVIALIEARQSYFQGDSYFRIEMFTARTRASPAAYLMREFQVRSVNRRQLKTSSGSLLLGSNFRLTHWLPCRPSTRDIDCSIVLNGISSGTLFHSDSSNEPNFTTISNACRTIHCWTGNLRALLYDGSYSWNSQESAAFCGISDKLSCWTKFIAMDITIQYLSFI